MRGLRERKRRWKTERKEEGKGKEERRRINEIKKVQGKKSAGGFWGMGLVNGTSSKSGLWKCILASKLEKKK